MARSINEILHTINSLEDRASMAELEVKARSRAEQEKIEGLREITEELQQNLFYSRNKLNTLEESEARFESAASKYAYEVEEVRRAIDTEYLSEEALQEAEVRIRDLLKLAKGERGDRQLYQLMAVRGLAATGELPKWLRERVGGPFLKQLLGEEQTEPEPEPKVAATTPDFSELLGGSFGGRGFGIDPVHAMRLAKIALAQTKEGEKRAKQLLTQSQEACGVAEHRLTMLEGTMQEHASNAFHRCSEAELAVEQMNKALDATHRSSGAEKQGLIFKAVEHLFEARSARYDLLAPLEELVDQVLPYCAEDPTRVEPMAQQMWKEARESFEEHVRTEVLAQQALFEVQNQRIEAEASLMLAEDLKPVNVDRAIRLWSVKILSR